MFVFTVKMLNRSNQSKESTILMNLTESDCFLVAFSSEMMCLIIPR